MWIDPPGADAVLVLAHGAGSGMRTPFMAGFADEIARLGVATLRFEFAYMRAGRRAPDRPPVLLDAWREAFADGGRRADGRPVFAGGKSMGGRMTSQADAESPLAVRGLIFVGFPLHPAKQPATKRSDHLARVTKPMLFLQGTRDDLADLSLLGPIVRARSTAQLHVVDGADHAFHVLKRSGRTNGQVLDELADAIRAFVDRVVRSTANGAGAAGS
jgi:predicted alpha/beta-hydrolase family hydrolase